MISGEDIESALKTSKKGLTRCIIIRHHGVPTAANNCGDATDLAGCVTCDYKFKILEKSQNKAEYGY